jgi:hypothetical protein
MNRHRRLFTPTTANATLPLVSRVVADLVRLHAVWRAAVTSYELAQADADAASESVAARDARLEVGRLAGEIEGCLDELEQVGCLFRDFEQGLVDFPAELDGRTVCLCWQRSEAEVGHWHELDAGFTGRQPLDDAFCVPEGR